MIEVFQSFRMLSIPTWVRATIITSLSFGIATGVALIVIGIERPEGWALVQSGSALLGIFLPMLLIALAVWGALVKRSDLQRATRNYLLNFLPSRLRALTECQLSPAENGGDVMIHHRLAAERTRVRTCYVHGDCWADYVIEPPLSVGITGLRMVVRVELNVLRLNVGVYLPERQYLTCVQDDLGLFSHLKHTIDGAEAIHTLDNATHRTQEGAYIFNRTTFVREFAGERYCVINGFRPLSEGFLWNPAEMLFIAQDMAIMLRSFFAEAPQLFAGPSAATGPDARGDVPVQAPG